MHPQCFTGFIRFSEKFSNWRFSFLLKKAEFKVLLKLCQNKKGQTFVGILEFLILFACCKKKKDSKNEHPNISLDLLIISVALIEFIIASIWQKSLQKIFWWQFQSWMVFSLKNYSVFIAQTSADYWYQFTFDNLFFGTKFFFFTSENYFPDPSK